MFRRKDPENAALNEVIRELCLRMEDEDVETKDYLRMMDQMIKLSQLKDSSSPKPISRDTLILVAGNLAGIVLILTYENTRVITSKAVGFILKSVR